MELYLLALADGLLAALVVFSVLSWRTHHRVSKHGPKGPIR